MIHIDTHVVVWLFQGESRHLSRQAKVALSQAAEIRVSPLVLLELTYLVERRRIAPPSVDAMITAIASDFGSLELSSAPFSAIIEKARMIGWTRDPFDRMIAANALADRARLITADEKIRENFQDALWD